MGFKLSKYQYQGLIEVDIDSLKELMEDCLERDHIITVLKDSVNYYYPETLEVQNYLKFNPDGEIFNLGDSVHPVSTKKNQIIMEKYPVDPDAMSRYIVINDKPDEDGCLMAIVYKNDQLCKCGRPL